jgi:hypothetical protein
MLLVGFFPDSLHWQLTKTARGTGRPACEHMEYNIPAVSIGDMA